MGNLNLPSPEIKDGTMARFGNCNLSLRNISLFSKSSLFNNLVTLVRLTFNVLVYHLEVCR